MKKLIYISFIASSVIMAIGCSMGPKRTPGSTYMPDMAYSRAYESYPELDPEIFTDEEAKAGSRIYYDRKPVNGTVKRGQFGVHHFSNDSASLLASNAVVVNPLTTDSSQKINNEEATRLFNIYCAICHGTDMKGQGPLVSSGKWAGNAANLLDATKFARSIYSDGRMFYTITHGKNTMGGYGSQLNNKQRWMLVNYIRSKQDASAAPAAAPAKDASATTDKTKIADTTKKGGK
jgi:mono/diheme cytochrome c family protein